MRATNGGPPPRAPSAVPVTVTTTSESGRPVSPAVTTPAIEAVPTGMCRTTTRSAWPIGDMPPS
jgi:hypothetical protein